MPLTKVQKEGIETLINNNADNRVITGSGTANTLNGESNVVIDSNGHLGVGGTPDFEFQVTDSSGAAVIRAKDGANNKIVDMIANSTGGLIRTLGSYPLVLNTNQTERMRIDSSGRVIIGSTSTIGNQYTDNLTISEAAGDAGIQIEGNNSNSNYASIYFGDAGSRYRSFFETQLGANGNFTIATTGSGPIRFNNSGGERMRIDGSGNVGIGMTTVGAALDVSGASGDTLRLSNGSASAQYRIGRNSTDGKLEFYGTQSGDIAYTFGGVDGERMRIDSSGRVGIGTSSPSYLLNVVKGGTNVCRFQQTTNNQGHDHACINIRHAAAVSGQDGVGMLFQNSGGTTVGRIDIGQSTTGYVTSSDYRLKENATAISDGITRLKTLKPYQFNWIAEKGEPKVDGFFAHEVTSAVPEAITGTKDEVDTDNNPVYQAIDHSKLVPLLTAAIQEAIAKIEVLETKVAALEAA